MRLRILGLASCLALQAGSGIAQTGRDACLESARLLLGGAGGPSIGIDTGASAYGAEVLRWRAADGAWGTCRLDARGRIWEVRVEAWGTATGYGSMLPPAAGADMPGAAPRGLTEERGFDRRGADYTSVRTRSLVECQSACLEDGRCRAYTFSAAEERCWLKSQITEKQMDRAMITGYKTADADAGGGWLPGQAPGAQPGAGSLTEEWGFDRRGADYDRGAVGSLAECQDACRRAERCAAYTFDSRTRMCYLKDRIPAAQPGEGMVTGYKRQ